MITIEKMMAEINREIAMRMNVYPRLVESRKMSQAKADEQIDTMRSILGLLHAVKTYNSTREDGGIWWHVPKKTGDNDG